MSQPEYKNLLTIAERLSEALTTAIVEGELAPGSKINEPELASTYQVSRGPLREAICRLEGLHLVDRVPHVGARVISLNSDEVTDIYHVREALEGMAARLAARNMPNDEINEVQLLLDMHEQNIRQTDGREYFKQEGGFDFHYCVIHGSKNNRLIDLLCHELYHLIRMYRYRSSQTSERPHMALQEHRHIIQAIKRHDEEFAEILMRRHISTARKNIEQQLLIEET
ncbi:MAG: GntR family transcriptional regulator [Gammaproteobacteria bacterium]